MGQILARLINKRIDEGLQHKIESLDDLNNGLIKLGYSLDDLSDDIPIKGQSLVCAYYNYVTKDTFGPFPSDIGWGLVKRHYVFKQFGLSLFFLHCAQVSICLFVVLTHFEFYHMYPLLVAFAYCGAKMIQAERIILKSIFQSFYASSVRFQELFPIFQSISTLTHIAFFLMFLGLSVACSIGDVIPSLSIHGMFHIGTTCIITLCGLANGISAASAFSALTSFVAFRFVTEFDNVFVNRMCTNVNVRDMINDLSSQDQKVNYFLLIFGCICGFGLTVVLALYPLILKLTGVI